MGQGGIRVEEKDKVAQRDRSDRRRGGWPDFDSWFRNEDGVVFD